VRAQFHFDPVARNQPDEIPFGVARQMGQHLLLTFQDHLEDQARPFFHDRRRDLYGLVRTQGPFSVTAMQCSKWAE